MKLERGFSDHSISAYIFDVKKFVEFLELNELEVSPVMVRLPLLREFIIYINELGLGRASQARIISGLKAYFKYLMLENNLEDDPTELLETPKLNRKIPEVLSVDEVFDFLAGFDLSDPLGRRNRAIFEMLYACGLRVSELTELKLTDLFLDVGFIRVIGKGDKQRLVPIGEEAIQQLKFYLDERKQADNIKQGEENIVFLNRRGKRLTRVMVFLIAKEQAKAVGIEKNVSPHTFRHSFATHLVEGGAGLKAVQDMLGHESITTTEIYTHLDKQYLRDVVLSHLPLYRDNTTE